MFEVNEGDTKVVMTNGTVTVQESGKSMDVDIKFEGNLENLCVYVNGEPWCKIEEPKRDTNNDARLIKIGEHYNPTGTNHDRDVWRDRHEIANKMPPPREDGHRYGM